MPQERQQQLEALPGWVWDVIAEQWDVGFRNLTEFANQKEHCRVPGSYQTTDGYRLGTWVSGQRYKKDSLSPNQRERFDALPGWVWDAKAEQWEIGFRCLQEFFQREKHCNVPKRETTVDGYRIGQWLQVQRSSWETLSPERKRKLEAIPGWLSPA